MITIYIVKLDGTSPRALILTSESKQPSTISLGKGTTRELHGYVKRMYPGAILVKSDDFQAEVERRKVHTPEITALLEAQNLSHWYVYGSLSRPLYTPPVEGAVCFQDVSTAYYTLIAVSELLDQEIRDNLELIYISGPVLNFDYTFFASERQTARGLADDPLTQEYIRRLEMIARAAWDYYNNFPSVNVSFRNDLYEALDKVHFMDETI